MTGESLGRGCVLAMGSADVRILYIHVYTYIHVPTRAAIFQALAVFREDNGLLRVNSFKGAMSQGTANTIFPNENSKSGCEYGSHPDTRNG